MPVIQAGMKSEILDSLKHLSDADLVMRVKTFASREREAMAQLVAHIAELDTRDVHLRAGHPSLFVYCRDELGLSEHEAYNRIEVARAARRFPVILEMLEEGAFTLTTVRLLAPHLTADNCRSVLDAARGKRKVEVEEIVARLSPRADVAPSIRKLPASIATPLASAVSLAAPAPVTSLVPIPTVPPPARAEVEPLAPDRYKLQLTIAGETVEKLRLAKDMLRHAIPSGDEAAILDRALTALLADLAKRKFAAAEDPRPSPPVANGTRHIPAAVKRAVWLRDVGRCAFVGEGGRRCHERGFVEFHHVEPYATGGPATVENIQLRCRRHNDYEARAYFGQTRPGGGAGSVREGAPPYLFQNEFSSPRQYNPAVLQSLIKDAHTGSPPRLL